MKNRITMNIPMNKIRQSLNKQSILIMLFGLSISNNMTYAREFKGGSGTTDNSTHKAGAVKNYSHLAGGCATSTSQTVLEVNNVRTTILGSADMWWDLNTARYEIPKNSGNHSLFAGALWLGGKDGGGQLKIAAMNYRQENGIDYWPGPIDTTNTSVSSDVCDKFDKHFRITRSEVEKFVNDPTAISTGIKNWPGNGESARNQGHFLAPYVDANGDGIYDPNSGDYPAYDLSGSSLNHTNSLYGDETLWWVFNDVGNTHTETQASPIGIEIRAQAFGFATNDDVNNMTFYHYQIINRSTSTLNQTYFGQWVDADLGSYDDDYVGCDVARGLGYCYNGDAVDGNGQAGTYGNYPPTIGVDFFRGPLADPGDGKDNDRDGTIDESEEQIIMSKFVYYNNNASVTGEPSKGQEYYNYLSGFWKDGTPFTYGGDAYNEAGPVCDFMFPGSSDTKGWGTGGAVQAAWDEASVGNAPADRRFVQSAGPFTLTPGAVNYITTGVVWSQSGQTGNLASIKSCIDADDKAQALFDNNFKVLNGPDAPDMAIQELNNELLFYITNENPLGNNYKEKYLEFDPIILTPSGVTKKYDSTYDFEGYIVYQLINSSVSQTELYNTDKARVVFQCDVQNGISRIINYNFSKDYGSSVPQEMVNGADAGISHSFKITEDAFATGNTKLVNHKQYYYMAVCYGFNNFKTYDPNSSIALDGQKLPFKAGRKNVKNYTAIPHNPSPEKGGSVMNSTFGSTVKMKRVEGQGNGGNNIDLTAESKSRILSSNFIKDVEYEAGYTPVRIKVIDPLNVKNASFEIKILGAADSNTINGNANITSVNPSGWYLKITNSDGSIKEVWADKTLKIGNEQILPEYGISISANQVSDPGNNQLGEGFITSSISYSTDNQWLSGVSDADGNRMNNWIRSGPDETIIDYKEYNYDLKKNFQNALNGTWAPYQLCGFSKIQAASGTQPLKIKAPGMPGFNKDNIVMPTNTLKYTQSIDVVYTPDKSLWTRCIVLEAQDLKDSAVGNASKLDLRKSPSIDKNGLQAGDAGYNSAEGDLISTTGMGWFPGYAINIETGERLNMAYAEDSHRPDQNGNDMIWNPTANIYDVQTPYSYIDSTNVIPYYYPLFGGRHFVYVFGHIADPIWPANDPDGAANKPSLAPRYDKCKAIYDMFKIGEGFTVSTKAHKKKWMLNSIMWVNIPLIVSGKVSTSNGQMFVPPNETTVKLRVAKPYKKNYTSNPVYSGQYLQNGSIIQSNDFATPAQNNNWPMYSFSTTELAAETGNMDEAKAALEFINVVPNPYYAYSSYERNKTDNRIKIVNLPQNCNIKIYTISGIQVASIKKDSPETYVDWTLKNDNNIPISSGMYLIHVDVPNVGEKVLKWFAVMRPLDISDF